jgi:Protein of unknown function (DUF3592)
MAGSVTGIILLVLGAFLLFRGLPGVLQLVRARRWRRVPGQVVGSGVQGYLGQAGAGHQRAAFRRAAIAYTYEVEGRAYTGMRVAFGTPLGLGAGLGAVAAAQAARYEPGAEVGVWVDPREPANSVLRRSAPSSLVMTVAGAAVLVPAVLSL